MHECFVCGGETIEHINRFDRLCVDCGLENVGDRPGPMVFMGDSEELFEAILGPVEKGWECDHRGARESDG